MAPRLTVAIPTFDRNEFLRKHVADLLPQLNSDVRLLILDNASQTPVDDTLQELLKEFSSADVRIIRHRVNIGSSANVMRCLELCESPWLWVLGDDDRPLSDAIATAFTAMEQHPDCLLISCNGMYESVREELMADGLDDFVDIIPDFPNLTLISNNLLRVDKVSPYLRYGYFFAYSLYPYLTCVLMTLFFDGGRCCFSPMQLIEWGSRSEWSRIVAASGMGTLLDLPLRSRQRKRLAQMLSAVAGKYSSLAIHLLHQIDNSIDAATARHLYSQAWYRLYHYEKSPTKHLVRAIGTLMLRFPSLARAVYGRYRRLRGYLDSGNARDDFGRT